MEDEILKTREVMRLLKWSRRTIDLKIKAGIFVAGIHFQKRPGCERKWSRLAVLAWMNGTEPQGEKFELSSGGGKRLLERAA